MADFRLGRALGTTRVAQHVVILADVAGEHMEHSLDEVFPESPADYRGLLVCVW